MFKQSLSKAGQEHLALILTPDKHQILFTPQPFTSTQKHVIHILSDSEKSEYFLNLKAVKMK